MATTYDKASLVMIPSGYKDDKLYSIKPTDGSGDFTFSRDGAGASPATRVNASGLIEKGRENVLLQSNTFSNATWLKVNVSVTSGQSGYDGTSNAWELNASSAGGYLRQNLSGVTGMRTYSFYAKAGSVDWVQLTGYGNTYFHLSGAGSVGTSPTIASIESVGNGWYRCSVSDDTSPSQVRVYPASGDGTDAAGTILIQDAQLESGLVATDYIETTTAPVSAGLLGDMPRLDYSGGATCPSLLLEPSRVNVIEHSEYLGEYGVSNVSVSYNNATSPEGVQNATLVTGDAGTFTKVVNFNPASSGAYTISVFAKYNTQQWIQLGMGGIATYANFDIQNGVKGNTNGTSDIEDYGNGWYRCSVQMTSGTPLSHYIGIVDSGTAARLATSTSTNSFWAYGMQSEIGSYPTSYIPTYGSASTRGADSALGSFNGDGIFSSNWTAFCELVIPNEGTSGTGAGFLGKVVEGSTTISDWSWVLVHQSSTQLDLNTKTSAGGSNANLINYTWGDTLKILLRSDGYYFVNGTKYTLSGSGLQSATPVQIGYGRAGQVNASAGETAEIKQTLAFPTALTDAECIALTTI